MTSDELREEISEILGQRIAGWQIRQMLQQCSAGNSPRQELAGASRHRRWTGSRRVRTCIAVRRSSHGGVAWLDLVPCCGPTDSCLREGSRRVGDQQEKHPCGAPTLA